MKLFTMLFFTIFIIMASAIFFFVHKKISKNWIFEKRWIFSQFVGVSVSTSMAILCLGMASFFITDLTQAAVHILEPNSLGVKNQPTFIENQNKIKITTLPDTTLKSSNEKQISYSQKNDNSYEKRDSPEEKDMVGLSMTAVATAITAITFVLGLGTTWFSEKLKLLDEERVKLENSEKERTHEINAAIQKLDHQFNIYKNQSLQQNERNEEYDKWRISFELASDDIMDWLETQGGDHKHWNIFARINKALRSLYDSNVEKRFIAFGQLITFLPDLPGDDLVHVKEYCDFCHEKHATSKNEVRVWCSIFNSIEKAQYAKDMLNGGDLY